MFILRYSFLFSILVSILVGQSKYDMDMISRSGGIWYLKGSKKPFTGIGYVLSDTSGKKIIESKYLNGQLHGTHSEWWHNGKKRHTVDIKKESVMGGGSSIIIMEIFSLKIALRVVSMTVLQVSGMKMGLYILEESTRKGKN